MIGQDDDAATIQMALRYTKAAMAALLLLSIVGIAGRMLGLI